MTTPGNRPFDLVSKEAQRALEEFMQDFTAALVQGGVNEWAKSLGLYRMSKALKTTYPVPVSAAGYEEFKGDVRYRSLYQKSLELIPKEWTDGVSELARIVEAPDFIGWNEEPAAIAAAALALPNVIIAERLAANPICWDEKNFFATNHPYNVFNTGEGTFSNDFTGTGTEPSVTNLANAKMAFRKIKAANGKPLGLRMTHVLVPPSQEEIWKDILENDLLISTVVDASGRSFGSINNRHKGTVELVVCDEFSDDKKWYALARNKPGMFPWICQDQGSPEEILSDKSSELYKTKRQVGIYYAMTANAELALPHCVLRFAGEPVAKT